MRKFHELMPNVKLVGDVDRYGFEKSLELHKEFHYAAVNIHALYGKEQLEMTEKMLKAGMKPLGWTIDNVVWARLFAEKGMYAFMTNRPDVMIRTFK